MFLFWMECVMHYTRLRTIYLHCIASSAAGFKNARNSSLLWCCTTTPDQCSECRVGAVCGPHRALLLRTLKHHFENKVHSVHTWLFEQTCTYISSSEDTSFPTMPGLYQLLTNWIGFTENVYKKINNAWIPDNVDHWCLMVRSGVIQTVIFTQAILPSIVVWS